ncbi:MAG: amidohydrolase family protein [Sphingomicrobium sp.]
MRKFRGAAAIGLLLVFTTAWQHPAAAQAAVAAEPAQLPHTKVLIAPVADHHVHLFSPAAAILNSPPPLPEIKLPEELAKVLEARNATATDQKALEELYTRDAIYHRGGTRGWTQGNEAAAGWVKWTISDFPYRIVPVAINQNETSAQIAGYFLEGKNLDERFGTSFLSLVKGSDGKWRIASEVYIFGQPEPEKPKTAADAVAQLDAVGTRWGAVLSNAYYFDSVRPEPLRNPYPQVKAENDWTAEQVAQYPDRLAAFCSFNPTKHYALAELHRCASSGRFKGLKFNFNAAQLNFRDLQEVAKVRAVMSAANKYRLPMIIHVRPGNVYGREEAEVFLHQLVAAAPDVPIQIAHLWGGESYSGAALQVYADAFSSGDPVTRNLYFDVSGVSGAHRNASRMKEIAARMRQIGMSRMLYGSDAPPTEAWEGFRKHVPLSEEEFRIIASNVAPYFRSR